MIRRPGLWLKILLVAFLNIFLLVAAFVLFARIQFRLDLGSFLLTPARYRMLSISRLAALELLNTSRDRWPELLKQYSSSYPAEFFLFDRDGVELAGPAAQPPQSIFRPRRPRPDHEPEMRGPGDDRLPPGRPGLPMPPGAAPADGPVPPPERRDPTFGIDFAYTGNPAYYWAAVRVPLSSDRGDRRTDGRLVWRISSLWTNTFFFDYRPWFISIAIIILISIACWLPLIRSLTRTIVQVTDATGRIADGNFEITLPVRRRDELGRLSDSINQMAQRLSGFVNGQRRFLSDIAHELCSPIARIQFSLGILEQRASETERKYVDTIDEEVQHMSSLVNELLSFSKASMGAPATLESVNVGQMVKRAIERESTGSVVIDSAIPDELTVKAQPDYLFRSVSNVLRNAIRYAGDDGPIGISARQVESAVIISITDQGPGVPSAELDEILKPFYRPESARQRETGGVGLGLAIVRACMEACGGSVVCRNRVPKGFEVELKLAPAAHLLA